MKQTAYNAVWRWHFYAGLCVMPFLILLAVTGGLYLFNVPITHAVYRSWEQVPFSTAPLPMAEQVHKAAAGLGADVLQVTPPGSPTNSTRLTVRMPDGARSWAFVDPQDGHVLGTTRYGGVMQVIRKIHSLQYFGFWASCLIEIAAGWTIILLGTGIYLWWPRGRSGGVVTIRARPARRLFWRDLHAVTGALAAAVILFLAVTGMPWSQVWGARVQQWSTNAGLGEPRPPAQVVPSWLLTQDISPGMEAMAHHHMSEPAPGLPWAMERHATPPSPPHPGSKVIGIDAAIARFRQAGLPAPFTVTLPGGPRGAYVGSYTPGRAEAVRTMYLDQYTGQVIGDVGFRDYGPVAKAIEWGIQVHQGEEYGPLNLALMLSSCIAILLLAISSLVMWWKRRPAGALGIPPAPANPRHARIVLAIMVPVALLYPLVGASLLLALVVDQCVIRLRRKALLF